MASLVDKYFSKADFEAIETAIKKAELSTSGELVVNLAVRSRHWDLERIIHGVVVAVITAGLVLYFTREVDWGVYYNATQAALWSGVAFLAVYFGWGRFLMRRERRRKAVWNRALDLFHKIEPTRGLTGVLIFMSLEEDQAAVVADKGIAEKVPSDYWDIPHSMIVEAMKKGDHAEGVVRAVETIGAELARYFPREDDDINELPDKPQVVD